MSSFTVQQGRRYRATITLGWLERWADNKMIASRLNDAGFSEVQVTGTNNRSPAREASQMSRPLPNRPPQS